MGAAKVALLWRCSSLGLKEDDQKDMPLGLRLVARLFKCVARLPHRQACKLGMFHVAQLSEDGSVGMPQQ